MKNIFFNEYPIGLVGIVEDSGAISRVFFAGEKHALNLTHGSSCEKGASSFTHGSSCEKGASSFTHGSSCEKSALNLTNGKSNFINFEVDGFREEESDLIRNADLQLKEYFSGKRKQFDLPLKFEGTGFQTEVWKALICIPYGDVRSYKEIAAAVGNIKACRAVGMANNRNPIAVIVPCHRVIGASGALTGYAGGLEVKKYLLELERCNK